MLDAVRMSSGSVRWSFAGDGRPVPPPTPTTDDDELPTQLLLLLLKLMRMLVTSRVCSVTSSVKV